MIRLYVGEYLTSPVPLHFGLNWCSHRCWYCFANLNNPSRRSKLSDIAKIARWFDNDSPTLEAWMLRAGYPVLLANDGDPFARTNAQVTAALMEVLFQNGGRIVFQTRGGDAGLEDEAINGPKTMFYVSVTTDDDDLVARTEPNAPTFARRVDLIARAKAAGHHVVVGLNPFVSAWWKDWRSSIRVIRDAGVECAWVGELHMNSRQVENINEQQRATYAADIKYSFAKTKPDEAEFVAMEDECARLGINVFNGVVGAQRGFWDQYFGAGVPFFPTMDGWFADLEYCAGGHEKVIGFSAAQFDDWANISAPGGSRYKDYLMPFGRSVRNECVAPKAQSFPEVHAWYRQWSRWPTPMRSRHLALVAAPDGSILTDENGNDLQAYVPAGTDDVVVPAEEVVWLSN